VWEDECEGECGRDEIKARYRRQRIVTDITDSFPAIVAVNGFLCVRIPAIKWHEVQEPEDWMFVQTYSTFSAARSAAWSAAYSTARSAAWSGAWSAARSAARDAARDAAWDVAWDAAWDAICSAARDAKWDAARSAAWDGAWYIGALLVSDLGVDVTLLTRRWRAWELGFLPLDVKGDCLAVARIGPK